MNFLKRISLAILVLLLPLFFITNALAEDKEPKGSGDGDIKKDTTLSFTKAGLNITFEPIFRIAGGLHYEELSKIDPGTTNEKTPDKVLVTEKVVQVGFQGKVGEYVSFHNEIAYDMGVQTSPTQSHGPMGTGVWTGGASMYLKDNFIQLSRWGVTLSTGIVTDPGSNIFASSHIGGLLYSDIHTQNMFVYSGYNRGQGILLQLNPWKLAGIKAIEKLYFNFCYNSGNPASQTGATVIEGSFAGYGSFYEFSLSSISRDSKRYPANDVMTTIYTESLVYDHEFVKVIVAAQTYSGDLYTNDDSNAEVKGRNLKASLMGIIPIANMFKIKPFVNFNEARTEMISITTSGAIEKSTDVVRRDTFSAGLDINILGESGIGFQYLSSRYKNTGVPERYFTDMINFAGSYYINALTFVSARYAIYKIRTRGAVNSKDTENKSIYADLTFRLN